MTGPRRMICFDEGARRFQMRAAGIAFREGRLLVHRAVGDDFWALPGGRVEFGETSVQTLGREMEEELGCPVSVGRLAFTSETMFTYAGRFYHEIGFYHLMAVPEGFGGTGEICHRVREGQVELEFKWIACDRASLDAAPFFPEAMRPHLAPVPAVGMHLYDIEGA